MTSPADARIDDLLARMTLEEKIGQLDQSSRPTPEQIRSGQCGSWILAGSQFAGNESGPRFTAADINAQQRLALESRLRIPLITGRDVIHGHRTVWPIPLGLAASFDPAMAEAAYTAIAREARADGIHWTFTPMLDIGRDPRWGRVAEGPGEDVHLASRLAGAMVRGIQGPDMAAPDRMLACAKHFVAYGCAEGGRDYDTADLGERSLRDTYLPPFKAAIDAGCASVMAAFNEVSGVPMHSHRELLTDTLKTAWRWDGFVVSDWNGPLELTAHGVAADRADAAALAVNAGVDMDMVDGLYREHLAQQVRTGTVPLARIDDAVRRVLRGKIRAGLFEQPFTDETLAARVQFTDAHRASARTAARHATVLLKNAGVLPLAKDGLRLALVGPLHDTTRELLGTWTLDYRLDETPTIAQAIRAALGPAAKLDAAANHRFDEAALRARHGIDAVIVVLGEHPLRGGEANSVMDLGLPPGQLDFLRAVHAQGRPVVAIVLAGRALALTEVLPYCDALLFALHGGSETGPALAEILFGDQEAAGRLPVSLPRRTGAVPCHYDRRPSGRPHDPVASSRYVDGPDDALFPFGFGLGYTTFAYGPVDAGDGRLAADGTITLACTVTNTGRRAGSEVVQCYIRDRVASVTRPVRQLKGFERIVLAPGESRRVTFTLTAADLAFTRRDMTHGWEAGDFLAWIGPHSRAGGEAAFTLVG